MEQLARGTPGFSGAELYNLVNQAAVKASRDDLKSIGMQAFEYAKDKIMMGAERKSAVLSKETMKMTAFHEAGHALIALKTDGADPIHKATIMPRGRALGMVMQLPDGDQTSQSRKQVFFMSVINFYVALFYLGCVRMYIYICIYLYVYHDLCIIDACLHMYINIYIYDEGYKYWRIHI
jgi:ATP-dependent Zn protease